MNNIIIELSKYFIILCIAFYALNGFIVFRYKTHEDQRGFYVMQNIFMVMIHAAGFAVLVLEGRDVSMVTFYCVTQLVIIAFVILYRVIYPASQPLIVNNMCMLLTISLVILARLSYSKCQKQFVIAAAGMVLALVIPFLMKFSHLVFMHLTWLWALAGVFVLGVVFVLGRATYGSKLSFTLKGITFQPSEAVKLLFVFFVAAMFAKSTTLKQIIITSVFAMAHIGILALSKDLGSALIFFVVYVFMLYVATRKLYWLLAGMILGAVSAVAGYRLFAHVRTRFIAWKDPFSVIDGQGYQITQSLFAIGTGGWFGMGLGQGTPNKIPVVEADFIFSAISEELGCLFGLCIILICISNFLMFLNIAIKQSDLFYRLVALGMAVIYGFQMFLTIGGVTKFIPLTGVTLPLVSYGGTSVLVTIIMFSVIQGIYCDNG
ncbi:MAG: FtsW/RodA/SpoVE family cell cycle protein [Lachnospiraceae bacterium]|nr:FtsW/RodA/SpoVE family cell cycle protein [Lachnospiraceae bacterium]